MKILHISDTHNKHNLLKQLPNADVIVHSGDVTLKGTEDEAKDFVKWFNALPYTYKVFISGNHDKCLLNCRSFEIRNSNTYFLQDEAIVIDGLKFFGLGYQHSANTLPNDIDVLISHEPPLGILDIAGTKLLGNEILLKKILEIKPKCHLFGHAHGSNGIITKENIIFSNAALLDHEYNMISEPKIIEI